MPWDFYHNNETSTPAYSLVNTGIGAALNFNKQALHLNITVNNLFDKAYTNHLSRLKYEGISKSGTECFFWFLPAVYVKKLNSI